MSTIPPEVQSAIDRLTQYNSRAYNQSSNPRGFPYPGYIKEFPRALDDAAAVANWIGETGGVPGPEGRLVELRSTMTHIQWRYEGDENWTDLIARDDLRGDDGREIELQSTSTHIQWRYEDGDWENLVALDDIEGEKGDKGDAATVAVGTITTVGPNDPADVTNVGTAGNAVFDFDIPKGDTGDTGPANSLSIGDVTGGETADATITGTAPSQTLNLVLPKGDKGDGGDAATIAVGNVTTIAPGSPATVTNTGTSAAAVFDFEIPAGQDGEGGGNVNPAGPVEAGNIAVFADGTGNLIADGGPIPEGFSGDWSDLDNVPSTFPPSSHNHAIGDVTGLQDALDAAGSAEHTHPISDINGLQNALDGKQPAGSYATAAQGEKADSAVQPDDLGNSASRNVGTGANDVAAGNHSHAHFSATNNPHEVTKAQVGLGNVDNTADADKPVSTAVGEALEGKQSTAEKNQPNGYAGLDGDGKLAGSARPVAAPKIERAEKNDTASTSSSSWSDTGLSLSFELSDASHGILITAHVQASGARTSFAFTDGSNNILTQGAAAGDRIPIHFGQIGTENYGNYGTSGSHVWYPGSVGPHTIKLRWFAGTGTSNLNMAANDSANTNVQRRSVSTMDAMEVGPAS